MLLLRSVRSAFLLAVTLLPFAVHAQFQDPTQEELKMTSDPKSPGAAAVFLNLEEVTDDSLHFHSVYARIKVLEEAGKELATVELPYWRGTFQVLNLKARTIHPDGTIIPLAGKPDDILVAKKGAHQERERVFTLPSVEVGSILEYRFELSYGDRISWAPDWEIQRRFFVHKARYSFTPFAAFLSGWKNSMNWILVDRHGNAVNSVIWWKILPPGQDVKVDSVGRFSLEVADVPPAPHEKFMPPDNSFLYHVHFYYKSAFTGTEYWTAEARYWSKDVDHLAETTGAVKQAVSAVTNAGAPEMERAQKIYAAVQALDNTDFSRVKGAAELKEHGLHALSEFAEMKTAEATLQQKSGTRNEIALAYLAMVRAAGLKAGAMKVTNRERGVFTPGYLDFGQLQDILVIVSIDGKEVTLDPGEKMCPFGMVAWPHTAAGGIRQDAEGRGPALTPLQPYTANTVRRVGDVTVVEKGGVSGSFRFVMAGQSALLLRQFAFRNDESELTKMFDRMLHEMVPAGVEAHVDHFQAVDDPTANLVAVVKLEGQLGTATAKRLLLPAFLFEGGAHPFVDEAHRVTPVDMHFAEQAVDQVVFHLPAGFTVESAPPSANLPWEDTAVLPAVNKAMLATKIIPGQGQITIARQATRAYAELKPEEYTGMVEYERKAAASDQQQLVLAAPQH